MVIHLDTYHMNIEERRPRHTGATSSATDSATSTSARTTAATSDRDTSTSRAFFGALADIDYRGPITFESFSSAVVAPGLSNDLAIWRNLWDDGADLARHARRYIHDGLRDARQHHPAPARS